MIKKVFYGWWIVLGCSLIGLYVGGIVYYGFTAFFEPLVKEFGWSYTQISFATSLRAWRWGSSPLSLVSSLIGLVQES